MTKSTPQPTVLLLHQQAEASHYDWLIAQPGRQMLWTCRLHEPSSRWGQVQQFDLLEIQPHRRRYLTYEGPISDDRGHVQRVDEGTALIEHWTRDEAVLRLAMGQFHGRVKLRRINGARWSAQVAPAD